jgi:hypothetical protein
MVLERPVGEAQEAAQVEEEHVQTPQYPEVEEQEVEQ